MKIKPCYKSLYDYDVDQNDGFITIFFKVPKDFDTNLILVMADTNSISVTIPNEPPLVCGSLYAEILPNTVKTEKVTKKIRGKENQVFNIILQKNSKYTWPALVIGKHPETQEIDAKSTYFMYVLESTKNEGEKFAQDEILYAVNIGLPVAIRVYAGILFENEEREKGIEMLKFAADEYEDPDAMSQLGRILCYWKDETRQAGLEYLKKASKLGNSDVNGLIGQILSPFSKFQYAHKDPKEAVHYLKLAVYGENYEEEEEEEEEEEFGNDENKIYRDELDKILASGIIEENDKKSRNTIIAVSSAAAVVAAGLGIALFLHFRKKK